LLLFAAMQQRAYDRVAAIVERARTKLLSTPTIVDDDDDDTTVSISILLNNKLIQSHGRQGDCAAARQILDDMLRMAAENNNSNNNGQPQPNHKTWVQVLRAYAAQGDAAAVQELIDTMLARKDHDESAAPSTAMWNALLQAHAVNGAASQAEQVLYQMLDDDSDETYCSPDAQSFYFLLQAYRRQSPRPGVAFKVEQCLSLFDAMAKKQQKNKNSCSEQPQPAWKLTARTLHTAVAAMARDTTDPLKAVKAARVLQERLGETTMDDGDAPATTAETPSHVYRSLLNACAYTTPKASPQDKLDTVQVAVDAFNKLTRHQRNARVYGQFLRTVGRLLPPGAKRDNLVSKIWDQCCAAGWVDDYVLEMFEKAASDQLLLTKLGGFLEDGVATPKEWGRMVVEKGQQ